MIRVGKMADYGIMVTSQLTNGDVNGLQKTEDIANAIQLPITTVRKILQHLVDAHIVQSFRGINGGYRLAKSPHDIKVADVLVAIEGPIALTECSHGDGNCNLADSCGLKDNWSFINRMIEKILGYISIQDMAHAVLDQADFDLEGVLNKQFSKGDIQADMEGEGAATIMPSESH